MIEAEQVILVDTNDNPLGTMEKIEAHRKGLLHRAFSVFLLNDEGEMLIQQRALGKYHSPGLWSNTCCSHPRPGEATISAAQRRLNEEMGVSAELKEVYAFTYRIDFDNGLTEHEFDHVFVGRFNQPPVINPDEVADWKYISLEALEADMERRPQLYTHWFKMVLQQLPLIGLI
ncbi:isopentenyl-diphosphate Delta-isomerase [Mucilaginibacter sp. RS28]|uniref:Isopentenyl-diphosphate delta-isomerase n=1 Tax=Mucilaginibacter straminoryzae TaxID=2932774 RepID=A0A9X2BC93_9SPHI|nr:isopentenyl-diphosphate Delta-isomerase [Mucilaginibacter straminoryzae]MCJ8209043.1 isopentenyl-diphosphate Delta-isomerase [Mucilaginibacter straminoryzae]